MFVLKGNRTEEAAKSHLWFVAISIIICILESNRFTVKTLQAESCEYVCDLVNCELLMILQSVVCSPLLVRYSTIEMTTVIIIIYGFDLYMCWLCILTLLVLSER